MQEALRAGDRLSEWIGQPPPELDRREALAALLDVLGSVPLGESGDETGRVRVLSARSVRGLRVPYLFLAGLSEKAFPPPDRQDRLYGEAEAQRLIDEGLPLVARMERNREEMLLLYEAVTRASRRLVLSYPALDQRAQPLCPSPYLEEVERACGEGKIKRTEVAELSPVPTGDEPLSDVDFRVKAVATALAGNVSLLAGLVRLPLPLGEGTLGEGILAGLRLTAQRQGRDRFGPAEGMLAGDAVRAEMAARFAPGRTFSATELERYAGCPFRFYLEAVLGLEPLEDLALAVDYLARGRLAHEALAALHAEINRACGRPASPAALGPAEYERLLGRTLQRVLARPVAHPIAAALREVDRRLLVAWLGDYLGQHARYDALWEDCDAPLLPAHFEVSFGRSTSFGKGHEITQPLEVTSAGRTVRLSGRIDRVDTGQVAGQTVFNVLDYKTGASTSFSPQAVAAGTALQLPLYAMAVQQLLLADCRALPWQAGYWYVKEAGFKPRSALKMHRREGQGLAPEPGWEDIRRTAAETVVALAEGIRRAEFPVSSADEQCTRNCPFSTVCRINQVRALEKTWQPSPNPE